MPSSSEGDFLSHLCAFKSCLSSCVSGQPLSPACFPHAAPLAAPAARRWVTLPGPRAVYPLVSRGRTECGLWFQLQVNLLSKFLLIAKSCYEQRNFATAMQILGGLEHVAVRQSPVSRPQSHGLQAGTWALAWPWGLTLAFISGLENSPREDSGGHGRVESGGGTGAVCALLAAWVPGAPLWTFSAHPLAVTGQSLLGGPTPPPSRVGLVLPVSPRGKDCRYRCPEDPTELG